MSADKIANFVANIAYDQIPQQVVAVAKNCILDGLGVSLAGSKDRVGKLIVSHVKEMGGKAEASVIGSKLRTSAPQAALANGVLAHALDYDDSVSAWGGHLTAVALPASLASGEREKRSGKEIIEAFVAGWEVGAKIGVVIGPALKELGWHPHAVVAPLAAAAAACKTLKLDERQIRMALGITASEVGGLRLNYGTDTKPFHAGRGAWSGIVAALLARQGFTANEDILDIRLGLPKIFTQKEWDPAMFAEGMGDPFSLVSPGVAVKMYPSCGRTQRSIDAMLYLMKEHPFSPEEVEDIEIQASQWTQELLAFPRPQTTSEAKFSMQYCLAAAVLDGEVTLNQFTGEKVSGAKAQAFMAKVKYAQPAGGSVGVADTEGEIVTVKLRNGQRYSHQVAHARGAPQNPMTREDIISKFQACAGLALPPRYVQRAIELVSNLETLKDISQLMKIVTNPALV